MKRTYFLLGIALGALAYGGSHASFNVQSPGGEKTTTTDVFEAGAATQAKKPNRTFDSYLDDFPFYNGHMDGQLYARHSPVRAVWVSAQSTHTVYS